METLEDMDPSFRQESRPQKRNRNWRCGFHSLVIPWEIIQAGKLKGRPWGNLKPFQGWELKRSLWAALGEDRKAGSGLTPGQASVSG